MDSLWRDSSGDFKIVSGDACWEQDLRLEALTEPGELFYEDENGDEAYGFGLLDFSHAENDEFTQKEIEQRVKINCQREHISTREKQGRR